ncbi:hypothetical protein Bpfe_027935 [Biomphalaria pfeifferi]|uniref:Uncharacterized protein n=1 Tax=Biomphalaria pfeifferi TaxID=112525 RepID=A0AAD8AVL4_BIOPF|nr:hypothetical protein Bpfe_027935 [Biomphalaria pfeifferi]
MEAGYSNFSLRWMTTGQFAGSSVNWMSGMKSFQTDFDTIKSDYVLRAYSKDYTSTIVQSMISRLFKLDSQQRLTRVLASGHSGVKFRVKSIFFSLNNYLS